MATPVIEAQNLGKRYFLGVRERYRTLRDTLTNSVRAPFDGLRTSSDRESRARVLDGPSHAATHDGKPVVWALRDVSFSIAQGEIVGIIGRNGAGKSTLLKVLSRITTPTEGQARIQGRVGSLLEVGTGFHPELTGRENIILSGAILGMKKTEISRKFSDIVAFSGVETFIDTPVKFYSSGMYLRLAFGVAAHLEPDILLIDEVLAVGDAEFQKKCIGKMAEVASGGRTVLFVSHALPTVSSLCDRTILLDSGRVRMDGATRGVVEAYLASSFANAAQVAWEKGQEPGNGRALVRSVRVRDCRGHITPVHQITDPLFLEIDFECLVDGTKLNASFHVQNAMGVLLFATANFHEPEWGTKRYGKGLYRTIAVIPGSLLTDGLHRVSCYVVEDGNVHVAKLPDVLSFEIHDNAPETMGNYRGPTLGAVRPRLEWKTSKVQ
jgi:lipopolysaccharide transport system ATP-binding protein